jgi:murein DD-endopeptidase MepM/ murein hydrolase activator NlpD
MRLKLQVFPVIAPTNDIGYGRVISSAVYIPSDTYDQPRPGVGPGGSTVQHRGIDIGAPQGMLIVSAVRGVVNAAHYEPIGGYGVQIISKGKASKSQWLTYYGHMAVEPFVREGEAVEPGTVLGVVGHTGGSGAFAPHCHFHVKHKTPDGWDYYNPYNDLKSMSTKLSTVVADGDNWRIIADMQLRAAATGIAITVLGMRR